MEKLAHVTVARSVWADVAKGRAAKQFFSGERQPSTKKC